jgi:Phosphotransferase enzyme family
MIELGDVNAPGPAGGRPPWQDPQWLAAADEWISAACAGAGLVRTGPAVARCRMWSVVARVPVTGGCVWFKANPAPSAFEPELGRALSVWSPRDAPPVIAVDTQRAWALARDIGVRLDTVLNADPDLAQWHTPLRRYARLQILLADHHTDLLALGVPDLRPEVIADTAEAMFADPALIETIGTPDGPTAEAFAAAQDRLPAVREQCAQLAHSGIPMSLDHADLHAGNILGSGDHARPFDWGDAVLGHPFASLLVVLLSVPENGDAQAGGRDLKALRDVYLEPWIATGIDAQTARDAVDLALNTGALSRALSWRRVFPCYDANLAPRANSARWLARLGATNPLNPDPA